MAEKSADGKRRVSLDLSLARLAHIDALKREWGMRNRGDVLERLLEDIFGDDDGEAEEASPGAAGGEDGTAVEDGLDERAALVLIGRGSLDTLAAEFDPAAEDLAPPEPPRSSGGIDLPGFVRSRSDRLRRSLRPERAAPAARTAAPLPRLSPETVEQALETARNHWLSLYGKPASETVLEAAMVWLGRDIWPQCDQSEGRAFTWTGACRAMGDLVSGWSDASPSFERVIVTAGVLEDPFSGATLAVRVPTLIRRFVHRFRNRRKGTSFQTLEHTMTLQGALKILQLPTDPGHRLTLAQIREAYRELALDHHPDSGGSEEAMRRINEAYQLLKELYRAARPS